jgi:two-component system phosphate regulon sensor histidine kinase PhoR
VATDRGQYIFNLLRLPEFKNYFDSKRYALPLELSSPVHPHIHLSVYITLFGEEERLIVAQDITRLHHLELMRKDFVSNVSHEMRTPLTVISGYLETIRDNIDAFPPKWHRAIETMSQQSCRMEALISDLLLLARVETSEKHTTEDIVDVPVLLKQIRQDAIALSGDKQQLIELAMESDTLMLGDAQQLRSALSNLVFNAVKYTQTKGRIMLRWWLDEAGIHFSVKDNGRGFDPIHIPRLTERFYRVDPSRNSSEGGTGLGLAIVKHVMRNHDGELHITSLPDVGSEFTCHFPLSRKIDV